MPSLEICVYIVSTHLLRMFQLTQFSDSVTLLHRVPSVILFHSAKTRLNSTTSLAATCLLIVDCCCVMHCNMSACCKHTDHTSSRQTQSASQYCRWRLLGQADSGDVNFIVYTTIGETTAGCGHGSSELAALTLLSAIRGTTASSKHAVRASMPASCDAAH